MPYYKLTDQNMKTYGGFKWKLGEWYSIDRNFRGKGELCGRGWFHVYNYPLLAVLLNPIHANIKKARLFRCNVKGNRLTDNDLKFGFTHVRLIEEISPPEISTTQKISFGILCAMEVYKSPEFILWANNWLSGKERSARAAWAAAEALWVTWVTREQLAAEAAAKAAEALWVTWVTREQLAAEAAAEAAGAAAGAAGAAAGAAGAARVASSFSLIKIAMKAMQYK
jgi:hypothetical protein